MKFPLFPLAGFALSVCLQVSGVLAESAHDCRFTQLPDRVRIEIGGTLFSEYIHQGGPRPYFYPILSADGTQLNRDFPMRKTDGEELDHPHHRSLWFTHGSVNGVDFWAEGKNSGTIVTEGAVETIDGKVGTLRARHRWLDKTGKLICTDDTLVRIRGTNTTRTLDYEVTLCAPPDAPVVLGDTKEGSMAIRLAQWMTMPHKYQKKEVPSKGQALNSEGLRNASAWGKRAPWVDYFAPRDGKTYGVALLDHPKNPNHPTWWHVRDYGLFAANPFGKHDFEGLKDQPHAGDVTISAGGRLTLRWRFIFHMGDPTAADIAAQFRSYAKE